MTFDISILIFAVDRLVFSKNKIINKAAYGRHIKLIYFKNNTTHSKIRPGRFGEGQLASFRLHIDADGSGMMIDSLNISY